MLLFLIFALIIVSGLIAYLGDQIGMKVGKKRLSVFGIRPKYTSIIITILTGILIATITITLLLTALEDVRMAVFDMQGLLVKLSNLNQQIVMKDTELSGKDDKLKEMEVEIATTTFQMENIRKEKGQLQDNLDLTLEQYNELKDLLKKTEADYQKLATVKMELEKTRVILEEKIEGLEEQKTELESERKTLEGDVKSLQEDLDKLTDQMSVVITNATLSLLKSQLDVDQYQNKNIIFRKGDSVYMESLNTISTGDPIDGEQAMEAFIQRANQSVDNLNLLKYMGRSIKILNGQDLQRITEELVNSTKEKILVAIFAEKNIVANEYLDALITFEPNHRVYSQSEIVWEQEIDSNQDPLVIEQAIREILKNISEDARQKGILSNASGGVGSIGFSDFFKITDNIQNLSGKVKVRVRAVRDIWREDALSTKNLDFEVIPMGFNP